jgi:alkyl hydroperoxide reductase subunit AhpC
VSIKVGEPAPRLAVEAYVRDEPGPVPVEIGGPAASWTVLFFYPRDFTYVCPAELCAFAERQAQFALEGAAVVGASTDSWHVHRAWLETSPGLSGIRYPLIADPEQELTRLYGVLNPEDGSARCVTFVIDLAGIVRHIGVTECGVGDRSEEALRALRELRMSELQVAA